MISRYRIYAFWIAFLFLQNALVWSQEQTEQQVQTEESNAERSIVPYQRVFLPLELLDQISNELQNYNFLGRPEWEQIFRPFLVDAETAKVFERPPEVQHVYLSARLDGSNLVSNSSRVRFSRGSLTAESYRLDPWSLAINSSRPGENPISSRMVGPGNDRIWGHDRNGTPVINLHRSTVESAIQPLDVLFPWTLRSLATSKPTNLQFSLSIPRVSNSCLVLSLPKQASIIDADALVSKIDDWGALSERLGEWGEQADLELNRVNLAGDSRWLIELSGLDRCRFTISFEEASGVGANASNSLDYLVLEHATDHELNRFAITSTTKLEIGGDRSLWDRPLKFQLPAMSRIRSLTVAGREVGWRSQDGLITVLADDLRRIPATRESTTTVKISYLTILDDSASSETDSEKLDVDKTKVGATKLSLPLMQLEKSFVIKGLTTVKRSADLPFAKVETSAKLRPFEKELETQWEWSGYGADFLVEIGSPSSKSEIHAVTKVATQGSEPKITVRLIIPGDQKLPLTVELPKSWDNVSVLSGVSGGNAAPSAWNIVKDLQSNANRFYVYGGTVESASTLDLQVQHIAKESVTQLDFDAKWLSIEGKPVPNKLVIESLPTDWEILGLRSGDILAPGQLLPDEKSFATAGDTAVVCPLKTHVLSLVKAPPKQSARASITASIKRIGETLLRAEYLMKVDSSSSGSSIRIKFDQSYANVVTVNLLDKQGVLIKSNSSSSYNELDQSYKVLMTEPNQSVGLTADLSIVDGKVIVPVPRIVEAGASGLQLTMDKSLAMEDWAVGIWSYRSDGEMIVTVPSEVESLGILADNRPVHPRASADESVDARYDLTVDGQGIQRAFWLLRISSSMEKEYRIATDEGWDFELAGNDSSSRGLTSWIDRSGRQPELCVRADPETALGSYSDIEFATKRKGAVIAPEGWKPLSIRAPRLYLAEQQTIGQQAIDRQAIVCQGAIWFPKGTNWKARESTSSLVGVSPFALFEEDGWVWRPWSEAVPNLDPVATETTREQSGQNIESFGKLSATESIGMKLDVGWEKLIDITSDGETSTLVLDDVSKLRKLQMVAYCIGIFLGAMLVRWSKWLFCLGIVVLFTMIVLFRESQFEYVLLMGNGLSWGGLLGAIIWQIRMAIRRDTGAPIRQSTNSTIWDFAKGVRSESLSKTILLIVGASMMIGSSYRVTAQESSTTGTSTIPSIFIPFDSKEVDNVDQVLVPDELLRRVRGNPGTPYTLKSAKHQLKLSSRGMTVEGVDQLVSTYEIYVNEPGAAIEIPFKPSLQNFSRLLVDGREVTVVPALAASREYLTWTADRERARTIVVYQVPRWVSRPAATVGTISLDSREVDLSILPASNAILEVDSDPTVAFDVESQGAVLDKESGRNVVHLGALPSIRGKVRYEPSTTAAMTTRSQSDLTFDIELLLQSKTLIARTVLKAGAGSSLDKRLTIEADKMWEPIGSNWGNYRLVETRNGRLQYLKRYVFELATTSTERAETEFSIYWALADKKATEARLLFAECVEPVLRPRTLRFARVSRSEWNIEQITNWIPAISETESLNWPDLKLIKADQRATSLRVPQTGGGSLTRSIASKSLQARIASRWVMEADKQLLTSRIEFFGASNTDLLELELPSGFYVDEVTNRNAKVKVNEREENGIRYAQLIAERTNWENYDFAIRLVKRELPIETDMPIPWLGVSGSQIMAQTVEVAASKLWRVEQLSASATSKILLGLGEETGLTTLMAGDQIRLIPRSQTAKGTFRVSQRGTQSEGRIEVVINGVFDVQPDSMAAAILEVPQVLGNRWRSDVQILPVPCPITNRAWLKIPLDRRTESTLPAQWEVSFSMTPEEFKQFQASADWLRLVNVSEIQSTNNLTDLLVQLGREIPSNRLAPPADRGHFVYVENRSAANKNGSLVVRYWFDSAKPTLRVKLGRDDLVQVIRWNGQLIGWSQDTESIAIQPPPCPAGQWNEIEIVLNTKDGLSDEGGRLSFEVVGQNVPIYNIGATNGTESNVLERFANFGLSVKTILASVKTQLGESSSVGSASMVHAEFWLRRLYQMAQLFRALPKEIENGQLAELQSTIQNAMESSPHEIELGISEVDTSVPRAIDVEATQWRAFAVAFLVVLVIVGVLLLTDSTRFPLVTSALSGGAVWLLTGLWPVFALVLIVVCVVAIDTIWINRLNRRLVR